MSGITGKVVAITGASSGIGEATARLLADGGAKVVLGARRTERLDDIAREIREGGGTAITCRTDVARRADVEGLVGMATDEFDHLDVLVSTPAINVRKRLLDMSEEEFDRVMSLNLQPGIAKLLRQVQQALT